MRRKSDNRRARRGAVTVEFALVAPVFLTLVLGVTEASRLFEMQNQLQMAAREGARLAVMDREGLVQSGSTTNSKVQQDVKNFLSATGVDPAKIAVQIVNHENPAETFNLDDPANSLKYFEVRVTVPYDAISSFTPPDMADFNLQGKIVFRNAKSFGGE